MKKKLVRLLLVLVAIVLGLIFLWPLSFSDCVTDNVDLCIVLTDTNIEDGVQNSTSTDYVFQPDSETFKQIQQILSRYSFHCSLRTFFSGASMDGNDAGYWLSLYSGEKEIISGGTGEIIVNNHVYRIGYWDNNAAITLMNEIRDVLANSDLSVSEANFSSESDDMPRSYFLENATQKEKFERLLSVIIYPDGKAELATPLISSYMLMPCKYSFENNELLIRFEDGSDVIAAFTVAADDILVFSEASVPLFADAGARYVYTPRWLSFDNNKIIVYADNIPEIEVYQVINGQINQWAVSDKDEIASFAEWAENIILEKAIFAVGHSPGDSDGENVYLLSTSFGGGLFEYGKYSDGEYYIYLGGEWYHVKNPSIPPLSDS